MNYDFTLDRRGMFSVLGSSVLMGALLFIAGLIVGSYWTANGPTVSAAAKRNVTDRDLNAPAQGPVRSELSQFDLTAPEKQAATLNSEAGKSAALTAPQTSAAPPPAAAGAEPPPAAQDQGGDNNKASAPADSAEKKTEKPADAAASAQAGNATNLVTVEVATFLDANAANHLFKNLERKGYAPTFFTGRDAQSREWYSIRIGAYSDKQQAENAAANFAKQEKMKAVVRPLGSL